MTTTIIEEEEEDYFKVDSTKICKEKINIYRNAQRKIEKTRTRIEGEFHGAMRNSRNEVTSSIPYPPDYDTTVSKIRCYFCCDPAMSNLMYQVKPMYTVRGDQIGFTHLWRHIMLFLSDITLDTEEISLQNKKYMKIANMMYKELKDIQSFNEPVVTDPFSRIKKIKVNPEKIYEKVVGESLQGWMSYDTIV